MRLGGAQSSTDQRKSRIQAEEEASPDGRKGGRNEKSKVVKWARGWDQVELSRKMRGNDRGVDADRGRTVGKSGEEAQRRLRPGWRKGVEVAGNTRSERN